MIYRILHFDTREERMEFMRNLKHPERAKIWIDEYGYGLSYRVKS